MPTISVIVPVYKVEDYLARCVESVLAQTFRDFELILVDDGSPDNCGALCDGWAEKDSRIRVIHKENGGLADARNAGTAVARGEYITYVDSDDYIHPRMLEALHSAAAQHHVLVACCAHAEVHGEPLAAGELPVSLCTPREYFGRYTINATVAWGKLYHKSVVFPYPVGKIHEDEYVTYRILFAQKQLAFVDTPLYAYFQNENGIMKGTWNPRKLDIFPAIEEQITFFLDKGYQELVKERIIVHKWFIHTNMKGARQHPDRRVRRKSLRYCRGRLRFHLRAYKPYAHYNLLDNLPLFDLSAPALKPLFRMHIWVWKTGSKIKRLFIKH